MNKAKKLSVSIVTMVILCMCLCITSFAMGMAVYEVRDNHFQTGGIDIDLNGGRPVISAEEFLFEPGMTVEKPFYIQNNGTWAVYYLTAIFLGTCRTSSAIKRFRMWHINF